MFDTIQTTIDMLLDDISRYSKSPYNYDDDKLMKSHMVDILTILLFVAHRLDELPITMDGCREEATTSFELARKT